MESSCQKNGNQWVVSYPRKRDHAILPENKCQAMKKLEATERQLMKNPEHAQAYDKQMVEINEWTGYAFQENDPEPGCLNLRYNWHCIYISYHSQDRPTRDVGKGQRLGREITLRNSRRMDQPVLRNDEPQWHNLWKMSDTALCSWPPCTLCFS